MKYPDAYRGGGDSPVGGAGEQDAVATAPDGDRFVIRRDRNPAHGFELPRRERTPLHHIQITIEHTSASSRPNASRRASGESALSVQLQWPIGADSGVVWAFRFHRVIP